MATRVHAKTESERRIDFVIPDLGRHLEIRHTAAFRFLVDIALFCRKRTAAKIGNQLIADGGTGRSRGSTEIHRKTRTRLGRTRVGLHTVRLASRLFLFDLLLDLVHLLDTHFCLRVLFFVKDLAAQEQVRHRHGEHEKHTRENRRKQNAKTLKNFL